jgi:cytosine deaminase
MTGCLTVRNVRTMDGDMTDVAIRDGRLADSAAAAGTDGGGDEIDAAGFLMLPALVEAHAHFDKTLWSMPWRPNSAGATLRDYIDNERRILREINVPIAERAGALIAHCIAAGSLYFRSHIDVDPEFGLRHVEAMLALRERFRGVAHLQFVAFPQTGMLIRPGTAELMEEALRLGVETVGGLDPAGIDNDPVRHLETIFAMAVRHGSGIDIHLHDRGELGLWQIDRIADFTAASGLQDKVMVSHAYCLGTAAPARLDGLARRLADQGISIMTTAPADTAVPPVAVLREAGVNVCIGSDGVRDAWSPFGNGDMLERAMLLAYRFDWGKDAELAAALDCATQGGATALGIADYGLEPGRPANFILVPAETVGDAVVRRPSRRIVVSRGRVVARDGVMI